MGTLNEENLLAILFDPHSVSKVRVNAIVSMLDEFYETYDVKEGEPCMWLRKTGSLSGNSL